MLRQLWTFIDCRERLDSGCILGEREDLEALNISYSLERTLASLERSTIAMEECHPCLVVSCIALGIPPLY